MPIIHSYEVRGSVVRLATSRNKDDSTTIMVLAGDRDDRSSVIGSVTLSPAQWDALRATMLNRG